MVERDAARAPIPVDEEELDSVFDGPFDLPVDDLRVRLVVITEERAANRGGRVDLVPTAAARPTGEVIGADLVFALDRARLRNVRRRGELRRGKNFERKFDGKAGPKARRKILRVFASFSRQAGKDERRCKLTGDRRFKGRGKTQRFAGREGEFRRELKFVLGVRVDRPNGFVDV